MSDDWGDILDTFNVSDYETRSFDPLPKGVYDVLVTAADQRATKTGGLAIGLRLDVTSKDHSGRVLFDNLNIKNNNPTAEQIGRETLAELMRCCKVQSVAAKDGGLTNLLNKSCKVRVKVDPKDSTRNVIQQYLPVDHHAPMDRMVAQAVQTKAAALAQPPSPPPAVPEDDIPF